MKWVLHGRGQRFVAAFLIGLLLALLTAQVSRAEEPQNAAPPVGYDISWPQCDGPYPRNNASIGIIGVNGGRPFTGNKCLRSQWEWTAQFSQRDAVYMNLDFPRALTVYQFFGGAGFCAPNDVFCQMYNYGWNAARDAVGRARAQGVVTDEWWLDVETMNHWSDNKFLNECIIAGAIDYLKSRDMKIGIYSTPYQWGVIAGPFAPGLPVWTAGAANYFDAVARCSNPRYAFGGGRVELVQYVEVYDTNVICK